MTHLKRATAEILNDLKDIILPVALIVSPGISMLFFGIEAGIALLLIILIVYLMYKVYVSFYEYFYKRVFNLLREDIDTLRSEVIESVSDDPDIQVAYMNLNTKLRKLYGETCDARIRNKEIYMNLNKQYMSILDRFKATKSRRPNG